MAETKIQDSIIEKVVQKLKKENAEVQVLSTNRDGFFLNVIPRNGESYTLNPNDAATITMNFFTADFLRQKFFLSWEAMAERIGNFIFEYLFFEVFGNVDNQNSKVVMYSETK